MLLGLAPYTNATEVSAEVLEQMQKMIVEDDVEGLKGLAIEGGIAHLRLDVSSEDLPDIFQLTEEFKDTSIKVNPVILAVQ